MEEPALADFHIQLLEEGKNNEKNKNSITRVKAIYFYRVRSPLYQASLFLTGQIKRRIINAGPNYTGPGRPFMTWVRQGPVVQQEEKRQLDDKTQSCDNNHTGL